MSHEISSHPARRARVVADLPIDSALARAEEMARRWAIALIIARPLQRIGDLPLEDLACEAPLLCAQAIRALASDVELDRLTGTGAPSARESSTAARRLAAMTGALDAPAVVVAVEALRGVLWETLLEETPPSLAGSFSVRSDRACARQVADLSDRLGYVCASLLAAAIPAIAAPAEGNELEVIARTGEQYGAQDSHSAATTARSGILIDEGTDRHVSSRPPTVREAVAPSGVQESERPLSWDESPPVPPGASHGEIEIRDERGEQGPAAWIGSIGRHLERFEQDRLPFAALLIELLDIERIRREHPAELARLASEAEVILVDEARAVSGSLTHESPGRYWLLVPQTDRNGADRLAERLAHAVRSSRSTSSSLLEVAIGTAVCPEDGREVAALAAHADIGLYAARSSARQGRRLSTAPVDPTA